MYGFTPAETALRDRFALPAGDGTGMATGTAAMEAVTHRLKATRSATGWVAGFVTIYVGSAAEVDDIAAQWGVTAGWTSGRTQYVAQVFEGYQCRIGAAWIPLQDETVPGQRTESLVAA